ncbi:TPA: DNA primase, partial [Acinetobacter baumannii]
SKLNYLLSLYRFKFDSKYSIPDIYIKDENQHTQVITDLSSTDKFDGLVRKILKDQEPNRLDLRYPSIVSGLAHETSKNFRHGENVNPEQFSNVFGFRAIQFGNWVTQQERQHLLNITFDGLSELRDALGFDSKNISLNGTLAIAFGARGQAGRNAASAHYEYASKIFNLTKQNGAGCLAHEWFHGLDAYMAQLVRKDVEKLIYKSGNFESVENNYFLTHLMSDVDYKT